jgi:hypothetical protein
MSTLIASNLQASGGGGTAALLASINGGPISGARNRIINGDMRIDQRNGGAAVTINTGGQTFSADRWYGQGQPSDGVFSLQQVADAPGGFSNSLRATVTTADASLGASQSYRVIQRIEGNNLAGLGLGTSSATSFTISFWVKSSIAGTFGGSLWGAAATEWYVFSYSISSANTWEYKTITVAARTTGSFDTTTGTGLQVQFSLGAGSSAVTTAGSWITGATEYYGATGQVNLIGTNGATWQITGVQLEAGTVATPFERRSYGQELSLCQRYYCKSCRQSEIPGAANITSVRGILNNGGTRTSVIYKFPATMRTVPTVTLFNPATGAAAQVRNEDANTNITATPYAITEEGVSAIDAIGTAGQSVLVVITASSEL